MMISKKNKHFGLHDVYKKKIQRFKGYSITP